jgi:hypothetical protein
MVSVQTYDVAYDLVELGNVSFYFFPRSLSTNPERSASYSPPSCNFRGRSKVGHLNTNRIPQCSRDPPLLFDRG